MTNFERAKNYVDKLMIYPECDLMEVINDACNLFSSFYDEYMELWNALNRHYL